MQAPELAFRELERCVRELGCAACRSGSHVNGFNLDIRRYSPSRDGAAARRGRVVHPWDMLAKDRHGQVLARAG